MRSNQTVKRSVTANRSRSRRSRILHLKQEGALVVGCYESPPGAIVEGTIEGRVITYRQGQNGAVHTSGFFSFARDASRYEGFKRLGDLNVKTFVTAFAGVKTSGNIGNCKHLPNLDGAEDTAKTQLEKSLAETGRAVLYGINFDFNSEVIKIESKPTLEKVVGLYKGKIRLENQGRRSYRQRRRRRL